MEPTARDHATCKLLFVTEANFLDETVEAAAQRELFATLTQRNMPCEVVCRFLVANDNETEPGPWLAERIKDIDARANAGPSLASVPRIDTDQPILRVICRGVPVSFWRGASTRPHPLEDAERAAFLRLIHAVLDRQQPDILLADTDACRADVFASARLRRTLPVALQRDCTPREAAPFRDAEVVLTPSRFAADYLRESLGLPCVNLPPIVAAETLAAEDPSTGAVVFDGSSVANGLAEALADTFPFMHMRRWAHFFTFFTCSCLAGWLTSGNHRLGRRGLMPSSRRLGRRGGRRAASRRAATDSPPTRSELYVPLPLDSPTVCQRKLPPPVYGRSLGHRSSQG